MLYTIVSDDSVNLSVGESDSPSVLETALVVDRVADTSRTLAARRIVEERQVVRRRAFLELGFVRGGERIACLEFDWVRGWERLTFLDFGRGCLWERFALFDLDALFFQSITLARARGTRHGLGYTVVATVAGGVAQVVQMGTSVVGLVGGEDVAVFGPGAARIASRVADERELVARAALEVCSACLCSVSAIELHES